MTLGERNRSLMTVFSNEQFESSRAPGKRILFELFKGSTVVRP